MKSTWWGRAGLGLGLVLLSAILYAPTSAATSRYEIIVNIPAFSLHLYEDGTLLKTYPIGVGRTVNPSQLGVTQIINNVHHPTYYPPNWYSRGLSPIPPGPENPVGTRWLGLGFPGYGIHGTNEPWTIGTAASSGCIRMFNHDVEELSALVTVGTRVTFVYETLEAWRDPLTHAPQIKVYADIYKQGTNTLSRALAALERLGVDGPVDHDALGAILGEAAGKARPIPWSIPLVLDGERQDINAIDYGGRILVPLDAMARLTGDSIHLSAPGPDGRRRLWILGREVSDLHWIGARPYASVEGVAEVLGLITVESSNERQIEYAHVRLIGPTGEPYPVRTYATPSWLLLPVQDVGARVGASVTWDPTLGAVRIGSTVIFNTEVLDGKAHLPHDRLAEHLGVQIHWQPGEPTASLKILKVMIASTVEARGFWYQDAIYVPLRPIAEYLGVTLGWHQETQTAFVRGIPVVGMVRDGRVYASLSALEAVMPSMTHLFDEDGLYLHLDLST